MLPWGLHCGTNAAEKVLLELEVHFPIVDVLEAISFTCNIGYEAIVRLASTSTSQSLRTFMASRNLPCTMESAL